MAHHLQRSKGALQHLQDSHSAEPQGLNALLDKGSFLKQSVPALKRLCKEHGINGTSMLQKAALIRFWKTMV